MGSSRNWLSSSNKNWLGKNILWKHHIQIYLKHGIWALCIFKKTLKKNIFPPVIKHGNGSFFNKTLHRILHEISRSAMLEGIEGYPQTQWLIRLIIIIFPPVFRCQAAAPVVKPMPLPTSQFDRDFDLGYLRRGDLGGAEGWCFKSYQGFRVPSRWLKNMM